MNKEKRIDYFLQLIMVILGVFIGMMASNWNDDRILDNDRKSLLIALKSELHDNLLYLKERKEKDIKPFFKSLDSISKVLEKDSEILKESFKADRFLNRIPNWPGLGKAKFEDAMFQATKFSNMLSNLEIDLLKQITKAYNLQYNIEDLRKTFNQRYVYIDSETTYKDVHDLMWDIMQDYFGSQYKLISIYEDTIEKIDTYIK